MALSNKPSAALSSLISSALIPTKPTFKTGALSLAMLLTVTFDEVKEPSCFAEAIRLILPPVPSKESIVTFCSLF